MKKISLLSSSRKQSGFTLLEMLLAVGVIGMIMIGITRLTSDLTEQRIAQAAGQQLGKIAELTEDVLLRESPFIFPGTSDVVSSGPSPYAEMARETLLSNGFPINNNNFRIANSPVEVFIGLQRNATTNQRMVRVIAVLETPFPLAKAAKIARAIGGRGGLIRADFPGEVRSAFGNWTYRPTDSLATALSAYTPTAGGGANPAMAFVVANVSYAESDKRGPYLSIYGGGEGENVMHTDIVMNGFSIVNAKDIDVGTLTATRAARFDELAVNGQANFQGGIDANGAVTVGGDLSVTDGDMSVTNGNLLVPGGNISAKGLRADTLEAEDLTTKDVFTDTLNVEGGDTLITSNVTVSGGATLDITGPLKATVVDAGNITADTMKTRNLAVTNTATLGGATTIQNTTSIDQLVLDGTMCLNGVAYNGGTTAGGC